ncbi:MAG: hypothetical protein ACK40X_07790 [Armatimonadota bacterium]
MKAQSKWRSVVQVADFCIDGKDIAVVLTDEDGVIIASITLAVVWDDDERDELYWALRRALEGKEVKGVIDDD